MKTEDMIEKLTHLGYDITKGLGRSRSSKTIYTSSDIHDGSKVAVASEEPMILKDGIVWRKSDPARKFLRFWNKCRDWGRNAHLFVENGEPFHGPNPKEQGEGVWSGDMADQSEDAYKLLVRFTPRAFIMSKGSGYHVKQGQTSYEEILAQRLNAIPYSGYFLNKKYRIKRGSVAHVIKESVKVHKGTRTVIVPQNTQRVDNYIWFIIHGKLINFAHHVGFSKKYNYRPAPLAAEMAYLEFDRGYYYKQNQNIAVTVRGHTHNYVEIRYPNSIGLITPAWKLANDTFDFKSGMAGTRPTVGGVKIIVEQDGKIEVDKMLMSKKDYPKMYCPDLTDI